mmetsp:Transcript_6994/g.14118  ORF Transcript_6994/g.14118 Transcript_6994/m.14118 type:complete len:396 (-) Transcript_6994:164-1351(-)|eukprot:CAMPEP_0118928034 /NCGR_PEP_ID=MMETSP1169-20130426/5383_1 /TAXON_ID=36882 /ORGANISM="Pyramimonas obovata, Strain CCMP722" /LENGTH=395 /DNA_ID=CAMNT_0006869927 /DNA_START=344 /DNA_END=1531 /DNA_ORIENTATION=+
MSASALDVQIDEFCLMLKRRQVEGTVQIAKKTVELLRQVASNQNRCTGVSLRDAVRRVGKRLIAAKPNELCVGNMVRRVLYYIREEEHSACCPGKSFDLDDPEHDVDGSKDSNWMEEQQQAPMLHLVRAQSLASLLDKGALNQALSTYQGDKGAATERPVAEVSRRFKHNVIECINDLIDELGSIRSQIAEQASDHIHTSEVILTYGTSNTVFQFLKEASKKRVFSVVVAEAAPGLEGHLMAKRLAALPNVVQTTLISDAAIFAMMARVNMVIVGARAVLANGGVMGLVGLNMVALAAKKHAVPFVVLTGLHKLSPEQPFEPEITMNDFRSPGGALDFEALAEDCETCQLHAPSPSFDYVPPHLVSLFITDSGGHNPSYVYRLLAEYYSPEDSVL